MLDSDFLDWRYQLIKEAAQRLKDEQELELNQIIIEEGED